MAHPASVPAHPSESGRMQACNSAWIVAALSLVLASPLFAGCASMSKRPVEAGRVASVSATRPAERKPSSISQV